MARNDEHPCWNLQDRQCRALETHILHSEVSASRLGNCQMHLHSRIYKGGLFNTSWSIVLNGHFKKKKKERSGPHGLQGTQKIHWVFQFETRQLQATYKKRTGTKNKYPHPLPNYNDNQKRGRTKKPTREVVTQGRSLGTKMKRIPPAKPKSRPVARIK